MITASVSETRRRLSELIELARQGAEVVIIKDSRPVAALSPIEPEDLELVTKITDTKARALHRWIDAEPKVNFPDAAQAARFLRKDMVKKENRKRR